MNKLAKIFSIKIYIIIKHLPSKHIIMYISLYSYSHKRDKIYTNTVRHNSSSCILFHLKKMLPCIITPRYLYFSSSL